MEIKLLLMCSNDNRSNLQDMHKTILVEEGDVNTWVSICLSSLLLKLSTDGLGLLRLGEYCSWRQRIMREIVREHRHSLIGVQFFEGCPEESGVDVLVICSYSGGLVCLICYMTSLDHLIFSCSSTRMVLGIRVCPREIHILDFPPILLPFSFLDLRDTYL